MPQRNVATNFTFEQQRVEINELAADFWTQKGTVDSALPTYLKLDGSNAFTGATLAVPNAFTINSNSGGGTVTIAGNLDVTGTTTTVSSANLEVTDKNILIAKGSTSDAQADGAGITIDSATDITFNFVDAKDALVSSIGLEGTTFLKGPYGQFTGSGTPTTGQGVEVNAPDANTGQIISYDRGNTAYKDLRIKGAGIDFYAGSTNAIVGGFHNSGLVMQSGKTIELDDTIVHSGDTDTKIRFPAADTVQFETGGSNRLSIDTNALFVQAGFPLAFLATGGGASSHIKSGGTDNQDLLLTTGSGNPTRLQIYSSGLIECLVPDSQPNLKLTPSGTNANSVIDFNTPGTGSAVFKVQGSEKFRIKSTATGSFVSVGNSTTNSSIAATFQVIAADGEADELYVAKFQNLEATAGRSYGVDIRAGSNSTDHGFRVKNRANDTTHLLVRGDGAIQIAAVAGTNTNASLPVLFQTATGVIEGGSGLTYNPGGDSLLVNGLTISQGGINGNASSMQLSCANHSSTCNIVVGSTVAITGNTTSTGTISDAGGNVRHLSRNEPGSAYTAAVTDAGKFISTNADVTFNGGIWSTGHAITIYNYGGSPINIVSGGSSFLMHWTDGTTAATGTRILAARGVCTLLCVQGPNTFVISGAVT